MHGATFQLDVLQNIILCKRNKDQAIVMAGKNLLIKSL